MTKNTFDICGCWEDGKSFYDVLAKACVANAAAC